MKSVAESYSDKETQETRLPVELYHFWDEFNNHWYFTSGDVSFTYDANVYIPIVIKRGTIEYNQQIEATKVTIEMNHINQPAIQYILSNPIDRIWCQILKTFRDQSPIEPIVMFVGMLKNVNLQDLIAKIDCTGFEYFLKRNVPRYQYQSMCNYFLYSDDECDVDKDLYKTETTIESIDSTGLTITSADFALKDDDYFSWGYLIFENAKRMIIYHTGDTIKLRYPITDLAVDSAITVYAGCNRNVETCRDKFDNLDNFFGMPYIPVDNPVIWS